MWISFSDLKKLKLKARDGEFGKVTDLFFDDRHWKVRFIVVSCGDWLEKKEVLISPLAIQRFDFENRILEVNCTKSEINMSPDIETHPVVSQLHEAEYFDAYGWPPRWEGVGVWAMGPYGLRAGNRTVRSTVNGTVENQDAPVKPNVTDVHLRSERELKGYRVEAHHEQCGQVKEFLFDDKQWVIHYLILKTRNWIPSHSVLIFRDWIKEIDWRTRKLKVDRSKDEIRKAPQFEYGARQVALSRNDERKIFHHFGETPYWEKEGVGLSVQRFQSSDDLPADSDVEKQR
jgi:uncharacterized protein YrrD